MNVVRALGSRSVARVPRNSFPGAAPSCRPSSDGRLLKGLTVSLQQRPGWPEKSVVSPGNRTGAGHPPRVPGRCRLGGNEKHITLQRPQSKYGRNGRGSSGPSRFSSPWKSCK